MSDGLPEDLGLSRRALAWMHILDIAQLGWGTFAAGYLFFSDFDDRGYVCARWIDFLWPFALFVLLLFVAFWRKDWISRRRAPGFLPWWFRIGLAVWVVIAAIAIPAALQDAVSTCAGQCSALERRLAAGANDSVSRRVNLFAVAASTGGSALASALTQVASAELSDALRAAKQSPGRSAHGVTDVVSCAALVPLRLTAVAPSRQTSCADSVARACFDAVLTWAECRALYEVLKSSCTLLAPKSLAGFVDAVCREAPVPEVRSMRSWTEARKLLETAQGMAVTCEPALEAKELRARTDGAREQLRRALNEVRMSGASCLTELQVPEKSDSPRATPSCERLPSTMSSCLRQAPAKANVAWLDGRDLLACEASQ